MTRRQPKPQPAAAAPSFPERSTTRVRNAVIAMGVLLTGVAVVVASRWYAAADASHIPPPPHVSGQQNAIAQHLRERYQVATQDPSSIAAVGPLCLAYHADMFFDLAERCYELASSLEPDEWKWMYHRAVIQSERGGGETLVATLREVVERAPDFGPAWLRLGEAEFKAGRYDRAEAAWQRARERSVSSLPTGSPPHRVEVPLSAYASLGLARVALVRGEVDRARQILEMLTSEASQFGSALRLLAESYRQAGRDNDADRLVYRAGRLPPYTPFADPFVDELARDSRNSTFLLRLASEANLAINAEWSEYLTRRAFEFDPNNPEVVVKLGRVLRTIGRNEEALIYFRRYQEMVPGDYQALAHIGSCLSAMGRFAEAETYFRKALQRLDDPLTHYNMGLLLAITGRVSEAVAEYEKALERDPGYSDARSNLAAALAREGKLDRAARELTMLLEVDPENAGARTNLGLVYLQQGKREQARAQLEEALRLDPQLTPAAEALEELRAKE